MLKFAANIGWMAQEVPIMERFQLVRDLGFTAVECPIDVYNHPAADLAEGYLSAGLDFLMFNSPPGSGKDEYGIAGLKGREAEFQDTIGRAIDYAKALKAEYVHILAGHQPGDWRKSGFEKFIENVTWACGQLKEANVIALIEPINTVARAGYLVQTTDEAQGVVDAVNKAGFDNIGIQFDFHNCQIMEGNLSRNYTEHLPSIAHIQIAGHPGRTPPGEGEINYSFVFAMIERSNYNGWIGCEYAPHNKTEPGATKASLAWAKPFGLG
ncbi:MAG: TIM barrel protein [Rhodospirillaceae bacterium]